MTRSRPQAQVHTISAAAPPLSSCTASPVDVAPPPPRPPDPATDDVKTKLLYGTEEAPPLLKCLFLAFQQYLVFVGGTVATPLLIANYMCIEPSNPYRGDIVATVIFVSGINTLLQATFGIRLPIIQGSNFAYVTPAIIIVNTFPACETEDLTEEEKTEQWQIRMRELQGVIAASAVLQVLLGMTGVVGILMQYVTPLTVVPTVTMLGLSLFSVGAQQASSHWGISALTVVLLILISQYMKNIQVPYPSYSTTKGLHISRAPVFTYFPLLLAMCASWAVCGILTNLEVLPEGSKARTDLTGQLLEEAKWFRIPYPGQWGMPTVSIGGTLGMTAAIIASITESLGDYHSCAKISERASPPVHAVNRAVACEGIGGVLAGLYGTASGTASYTGNIVLIGISRVASRRVIQMTGLLMLLTGLCGKLCASFATIPLPVLGSTLMFMFALITGIGLAPLQSIDLDSRRNLFILGFSIFLGLAVPDWLERNPGVVQTGWDIIDHGLTSLLGTAMFLSGLIGMILDNTIPGTIEERGLTHWEYFQQAHSKSSSTDPVDLCYDLPFGMTYIRRWKWTRWVPFLPTFTGFRQQQQSEAS